MKLKEYLDKEGMSLRTFAKKAGVHHSTIFYHLSGRNKNISLHLAQSISKATNGKVSFDDLMEEVKTVKERS